MTALTTALTLLANLALAWGPYLLVVACVFVAARFVTKCVSTAHANAQVRAARAASAALPLAEVFPFPGVEVHSDIA